MRTKLIAGMIVICIVLATGVAKAADRAWHEGTLVSAERQEQNGTAKNTDTKYSTDSRGNSHATTNTTTTNVNTAVFMIYTISDGTRTYEARQGTTVWQTKVKAQPGNKIQFAVDGDSLYVQREDGKESRMKVFKVSVAVPAASPQH